MTKYEELCRNYGELRERVERHCERASSTLFDIAQEFQEFIGAPKGYRAPISKERHPVVAVYIKEDDDNEEKFRRVRKIAEDIPVDNDGFFKGYIGLALASAPGAFPEKGWCVLCRVKPDIGLVHVEIGDTPESFAIKDGNSFRPAAEALLRFFERLLQFDPIEGPRRRPIGFTVQ